MWWRRSAAGNAAETAAPQSRQTRAICAAAAARIIAPESPLPGAYFPLALPAALLIRRIGYQRGILLGLLMVATGAAITKVIKPHVLLALYGIANTLIIAVVMADIEHFSWMVLPSCWLFMSIMFPFIFAMSLRDLGAQTKLAASFQIMSIVGGAIAPPLMGFLADQYHSMAICFILPLIGFVATTIYGFAYPSLLAKSARVAA